jgi:acetyl esterase
VRVTVDQQDEYYRALANRSGCMLAAVDYRLSPESRFPTAIEEVLAASRWLQSAAGELGYDAARFGILGESSGGNVAAAATRLARDRGDVDYAQQILLLPILEIRFDSPSWKQLGTDFLLKQAQVEWSVQQYAPGVDRSDPLLSPLCAADLAGLPPALIITAEYDPLRDDGERYAAALTQAIPLAVQVMDDLGAAVGGVFINQRV